MKNALLVLFLLLAAFVATPLTAPSTAAQRAKTEFMKEFRALMKINARDRMAQMVKNRTDEAVKEVVDVCILIGKRTNDQLEQEIDALGKAWKTAMETDFVQIQYEYHSLMRPEYRRQWAELETQLGHASERYGKALQEENEGEVISLGPLFSGLAEAYEGVGDDFKGSQCWLNAASCFDDTFAGDKADLRAACHAYDRALALREKVELRDGWYAKVKPRFDLLEYEGYGDPTKGPKARLEAKKEVEAAHSAPLALSFEVFTDIEDVERPLYGADGNYQVWPALSLHGENPSATFPLVEHSPRVVRTAAAKVSIDTDQDGEGDVEIPLTGNVTPVLVQLEGERDWAFLATIGRDQDTYQGFRYNMAPTDEFLAIYIAPAASVVGTVGETPIRILDDNMDGVYGGPPKETNHFGLVEGVYQPDVDSILVGESDRALPWSEVQRIGDAWYRLERGEGGDELTVTPTEVKTGTLKLDFEGLKPDWVVVRGQDLQEGYLYDLTVGGKKGLEVPVGTYSLYCGRVSKGKRDQLAKALILPSRSTPSWTVREGETAAVELGGPFSFDFEVEQNQDTVRVVGSSVVVRGKAGEMYLRLWNCVPRPEVHLRPAGKKKGSKEEDMRPAESQEDIQANGNNLNSAWFPLDATIEKKKEAPVEVQLFEKKNKLFGKIESEWK